MTMAPPRWKRQARHSDALPCFWPTEGCSRAASKIGEAVMRVDPLLLRTEKLTLVLKAIDGDKVRVYSASLDSPLVVLTNQALKFLALDKRLHVCRGAAFRGISKHRPMGFSDAGNGPSTK
jgi:hypothetical protein